MDEQPKRRGRPPGVKNKPKAPTPPDEWVKPSPVLATAFDDYTVTDPLTMVSRNYAMLDWAQEALRNEMKKGLSANNGARLAEQDAAKLVDVSNALLRTLDGHKKAIELAKRLSEDKSPAQLLEIAIRKIEAQDLATLQAIIKRLREHRARMGPVKKRDAITMDGQASAARSVAELGEDDEV